MSRSSLRRWSRKPRDTGFSSLYARSPTMAITEMCVSASSAGGESARLTERTGVTVTSAPVAQDHRGDDHRADRDQAPDRVQEDLADGHDALLMSRGRF